MARDGVSLAVAGMQAAGRVELTGSPGLFETKVSGRRRIGLNVQCTKYIIFPGHS